MTGVRTGDVHAGGVRVGSARMGGVRVSRLGGTREPGWEPGQRAPLAFWPGLAK